MVRLENPISDEYEEVITEGMSDYDRKKTKNISTHFTLEKITKGKLKGFDKVRYYRKKL